MNCRTVKLMAIAIGVCFLTATASNAFAKDKGHHGTIVSITMPVAANGTTPAVVGSIKVTETDASGTETTNSYDLIDSVAVTVKGEEGKLEDIKEKDKIHFTVNGDKKVTTIKKGRKSKKSS